LWIKLDSVKGQEWEDRWEDRQEVLVGAATRVVVKEDWVEQGWVALVQE
jgi:hypothetical protein